jgi:uncharacterized DUF497 family protein
MRFGWDEEKSAWNQQTRGLSFAESKPVFLDPYAIERYDAKSSTIEERYIRIGKAPAGLLTVVYTDRPDELRWIISVRRATRKEKENYYEQ